MQNCWFQNTSFADVPDSAENFSQGAGGPRSSTHRCTPCSRGIGGIEASRLDGDISLLAKRRLSVGPHSPFLPWLLQGFFTKTEGGKNRSGSVPLSFFWAFGATAQAQNQLVCKGNLGNWGTLQSRECPRNGNVCKSKCPKELLSCHRLSPILLPSSSQRIVKIYRLPSTWA